VFRACVWAYVILRSRRRCNVCAHRLTRDLTQSVIVKRRELDDCCSRLNCGHRISSINCRVVFHWCQKSNFLNQLVRAVCRSFHDFHTLGDAEIASILLLRATLDHNFCRLPFYSSRTSPHHPANSQFFLILRVICSPRSLSLALSRWLSRDRYYIARAVNQVSLGRRLCFLKLLVPNARLLL
jgi:hypothetical protein